MNHYVKKTIYGIVWSGMVNLERLIYVRLKADHKTFYVNKKQKYFQYSPKTSIPVFPGFVAAHVT